MLTDDELTSELKLAFDEATHDLAPAAGFGAQVHRRHRAARRRAVAMRIALPAAAACAGGVVVVGTGSSPSSDAPSTRVPTASGSGQQSVSRTVARTVAYVLKVPTNSDSSFGCIDASAAHLVPDTGTWYVAVGPDCTAMVVDTDTTLPADATPLELGGVPGLYGTTDPKAGTRTIYSRNPDGDWSALTVSSNASDDSLEGFYTPAN